MKLSISTSVKALLPDYKLGYVRVDGVTVGETPHLLKEEFIHLQRQIAENHQLDTLANDSRIAAVRSMYKKLKFDPSRYRPASEALVRRILQNKELYFVNSAVDVNNYCSIKYLLPFGLYDADQLQGDVIYDVAAEGTYVNIAGNQVSTEGKPFLKDDIGVFGNPTSDSRRTSVTLNARSLLCIIYPGENLEESALTEILNFTGQMLTQYNDGVIVEQGIAKV